jgi:hypothetical protein
MSLGKLVEELLYFKEIGERTNAKVNSIVPQPSNQLTD